MYVSVLAFIQQFGEAVFRRYKLPEENRQPILDQCSSIVGKDWTYPSRYSLNLSSHLEWYHNHGIDAKAIIIMRDATISRRARQMHCTNSTILEMEEELGREILEQAIHKYISLNKSSRRGGQRRRLIQTTEDGKVVLVSYELLNQLKDHHLLMLYDALGIKSTFTPVWLDGNVKHVLDEPLKKKIKASASTTVKRNSFAKLFAGSSTTTTKRNINLP